MCRLILLSACIAFGAGEANAAVGDAWDNVFGVPFAGRTNLLLVEFDGRFWAGGGTARVCPCQEIEPQCNECWYETYNDFWVSDDARNWTLVTEDRPFSHTENNLIVSFRNRLYIFRTGWGEDLPDVAISDDGVRWEQLNTPNSWAFGAWNPPLVFKGELVLVGSGIYSPDGVQWLVSPAYDYEAIPFTNLPGKLRAVALGDYIYAFKSGHIWRSPDGYQWEELTGNISQFDDSNNMPFTSFAGFLWLVGESGFWRSPDGTNWTRVLNRSVTLASNIMASFGESLYVNTGGQLKYTTASCKDLVGTPYSSDRSECGRIDLGELLRAIQLFSFGEFRCDATGEDGYAPGTLPEGEGATPAEGEAEATPECVPHSADYKPQDWSISLDELLRLIQLYNAGSYSPCPNTEDSEDGFCIP